LGGVAIFLAFLGSIGIASMAVWLFPALEFSPSVIWPIFLPGLLIFLLGIYDDIHPIHPYVKFLGQAVAAAMLYAFGLRISDLPVLFGHHHFPFFLGLPLTILWVLAITNAFNLIDGLDGLAAGSALFSTLVVFVVSLFSNSHMVSLMALALSGAILGFLRYNFNPATIFLGDCGSLFIGFMLSALALRGAQKAPTTIAIAIPVVSFGLPILETALSVLRRLIAGRPVFTADREHIHHKLLESGLSHRQVVIVLYGVSAVFALLSLFLLWPTGSSLGLVLAVLGTGVWLGVQRLGYLEFGELRRVAERTMSQPQIFVNNLAIRRATEELKVAVDYEQVSRILTAAFSANDFDGFDLHWFSLAGDFRSEQQTGPGEAHPSLQWKRPGAHVNPHTKPLWSLNLDLLTEANRHRGFMKLYRTYDDSALQVDINLLIFSFPTALAGALDRAALRNRLEAAQATEHGTAMAAQAG
jgi:UDP-GlcNAc:undecaprenyl-phosphate GlcNAc-1-phosphate transferase